MIIRPALIEDAHGIAVVHIKTWQESYRGQVPDSFLDQLSIEQRTEFWKRHLENPTAGVHTFVSEADLNILGWCSVGPNRDDDIGADAGELWAIYVLPAFSGQGIGSALMQRGLDLLKQQGYTKATLWTLRTNARTRAWYQSRGWTLDGGVKSEQRDDFVLDEVRYVTTL